MQKYIEIKGARVHNLKNLDVKIPHGKLTVITGLSGSGKSSLAFDTLYAEGQRRYIESLSSYARQFLGKLDKPETDYIKGISPAIAIEQKVISNNPRSTVGTSTEIYNYIKILFARVGKTFSPISGLEVKKHTVADVVDFFKTHEGQRAMILAPILGFKKYGIERQLNLLKDQGYVRLFLNKETLDIEEVLKNIPTNIEDAYLLIDRIKIDFSDEDENGRMSDSIGLAFTEGEGICDIFLPESDTIVPFSTKFELDGMEFQEPSEHFFAFNNPYGACKKCEGFGQVIGVDPNLVFPNRSLSVYEGAIFPWKGETMGEYLNQLVFNAKKFDFPIHRAIDELTQKEYQLLWEGNKYFTGLNEFFKFLESQTYKIQYRVMLSRYRGKTECPDCKGTRLRKDANYVLVNQKSVTDVVLMPVSESSVFFQKLELNDYDRQVANRILPEIVNYHMPDSLQTIVSSWNCSEKVVSVGNITNRNSYIDKNNVTQVTNSTPAGQLAPSSSKGPNRLGIMKPDVSASGDFSFGSGPMWYLSNSANNSVIEVGGFHIKNGGTSMSSPVVAGSAALYLQKCKGLSYQDFKSDLQLASNADFQTGITPNYSYGYGKLNTQDLILLKHQPATVQGPAGICVGGSINLTFNTNMTPSTILWSNGSTTNSITTSNSGNFSVYLEDAQGCRTRSAIKNIQLFQLPYVDAGPNHILCPNEPFILIGNGTASNYTWSNNIQNNTSFIPQNTGFYYLTGTDLNNCSNIDSTFLDFYTLMPVSYIETINEITSNGQAFNVTPGTPNGGTYSGEGIIGTTFHPGLAGEGTHAIVYSVQNSNGCFSTDTSYITVLSAGGVTEQNQLFTLYPNPTQSNLTIDSPLKLISIDMYSSEGKWIKNFDVSANLTLNVESLKPGIYYISLQSEIGISKIKFIKVN